MLLKQALLQRAEAPPQTSDRQWDLRLCLFLASEEVRELLPHRLWLFFLRLLFWRFQAKYNRVNLLLCCLFVFQKLFYVRYFSFTQIYMYLIFDHTAKLIDWIAGVGPAAAAVHIGLYRA